MRELKKMSIKKAKKLERQKMTHGAKSQKLEMEEVAETGTVPGIIEMEEIERFEDKAEGTVPGIIEMEEIESFEDEAEGDDEVVVLEELEEVVEELTEELVAVETEIVDMNHKGVKSRTAAKTHKPTATKTDTPTREPATATPMADNPKSGKTHKPRSRTAAKTHKPTATMTATPTRKPVTAKPTGRR